VAIAVESPLEKRNAFSLPEFYLIGAVNFFY
jgi:hypothetical protein